MPESATDDMNHWVRVAVICGTAPLTIGMAIFLLWLLTRWGWLMLAGIGTIYIGLVLVAVGGVSVVIFVWKSFKARCIPRKQTVRQSLAVAGLLLLNFPVAAAIAASAISIETRYMVTILNDSSVEVRSFVVSGGGVTVDIGTVTPGSKAQRVFFIKQDGVLKVSGMQDGKPIEGIVEGYVTNGVGGNKLVRIKSDGILDVVDRER